MSGIPSASSVYLPPNAAYQHQVQAGCQVFNLTYVPPAIACRLPVPHRSPAPALRPGFPPVKEYPANKPVDASAKTAKPRGKNKNPATQEPAYLVHVTSATEQPPPEQPEGPTTVFVGDISDRAPPPLFLPLLSKFGKVVDWKRIQDTDGKLKKFGFCTFAQPESAVRAICLLNGLLLFGQRLTVKCDNKTRGLLLNFVNWQRIKAGFKPLVPKYDDDFFSYDNLLTKGDDLFRQEIFDLLKQPEYLNPYTGDCGDIPCSEKMDETPAFSGKGGNLDVNNLDKETAKQIANEIGAFRQQHTNTEGNVPSKTTKNLLSGPVINSGNNNPNSNPVSKTSFSGENIKSLLDKNKKYVEIRGSEIRCTLCNIKLNNRGAIDGHFRSPRHERAVNHDRAKEENVAKTMQNIPPKVADNISSATNISPQKYFGCEICSIHGVPHVENSVQLHLSSKPHKNMKTFFDNGIWPGPNEKMAKHLLKEPKIFSFLDRKGTVLCSLCQETMTDGTNLLHHQQGHEHYRKLCSHNLQDKLPVIYICDMCDGMVLLSQAAYHGHCSTQSHMQKAYALTIEDCTLYYTDQCQQKNRTGCPQYRRHVMYYDQLCDSWIKSRTCPFRENCPFRHSTFELQTADSTSLNKVSPVATATELSDAKKITDLKSETDDDKNLTISKDVSKKNVVGKGLSFSLNKETSAMKINESNKALKDEKRKSDAKSDSKKSDYKPDSKKSNLKSDSKKSVSKKSVSKSDSKKSDSKKSESKSDSKASTVVSKDSSRSSKSIDKIVESKKVEHKSSSKMDESKNKYPDLKSSSTALASKEKCSDIFKQPQASADLSESSFKVDGDIASILAKCQQLKQLDTSSPRLVNSVGNTLPIQAVQTQPTSTASPFSVIFLKLLKPQHSTMENVLSAQIDASATANILSNLMPNVIEMIKNLKPAFVAQHVVPLPDVPSASSLESKSLASILNFNSYSDCSDDLLDYLYFTESKKPNPDTMNLILIRNLKQTRDEKREADKKLNAVMALLKPGDANSVSASPPSFLSAHMQQPFASPPLTATPVVSLQQQQQQNLEQILAMWNSMQSAAVAKPVSSVKIPNTQAGASFNETLLQQIWQKLQTGVAQASPVANEMQEEEEAMKPKSVAKAGGKKNVVDKSFESKKYISKGDGRLGYVSNTNRSGARVGDSVGDDQEREGDDKRKSRDGDSESKRKRSLERSDVYRNEEEQKIKRQKPTDLMNDFVSVPHCYKCNQDGHIINDCPLLEQLQITTCGVPVHIEQSNDNNIITVTCCLLQPVFTKHQPLAGFSVGQFVLAYSPTSFSPTLDISTDPPVSVYYDPNKPMDMAEGISYDDDALVGVSSSSLAPDSAKVSPFDRLGYFSKRGKLVLEEKQKQQRQSLPERLKITVLNNIRFE